MAHLVDVELANGKSPKDAFSATLKKLHGAYAFGLIIDGVEDQIFCARAGSPLAIGIGDDEHYLCLLYTSPSPRDGLLSRMPSSA